MNERDKFLYLKEETYKTIVNSIPIICVDIIPIKQVCKVWNIGIIRRSTGSESGKFAILGGRISLNETITEAINRHLLKDLGVVRFSFYKTNEVQKPFYVLQYFKGTKSKEPFGFDPTKHAIALTYLVEIKEVPLPKNEASEFRWITNKQIPKQVAFNQNIAMQEAFEQLKG